MNLNELPDMSDALKKVQQFDEKKKLDPVGQEDADVDNDGDSDSSDEYLKKRRKAISKAMKKEEVEELEETKLGDTAYARARDAGAQRRRTKEYKQGLNRSTTRKEKGMYRLATAQRRTDADLERQKTTYDTGAHKGDFDRAKRARQYKKEAFAFSEVDFEELDLFVEDIDALTDEQLVEFFEEAILEMAEDDQDLIEICEHLEEVEMLTEVSDKYYDSAVKSSKAAAKANRPSRMERLKSAAKSAGSKVKAGVKAVGKKAVSTAGKVAGTYQGSKEAARIKAKRKSMQNTPAKKKDDDGTGGKLDKLLADTRGKSSSSSSSSGGGGERDAGSEARERLKSKKKGPGLLRRIGGAIKRGLKKAVGKTSRLISKGSDKLAKRMGEEYDRIAHLHESGLFTIQEIESIIEEGYKPIDKKKETAMYRRAGNLSREALSKGMNTKAGSKAQDKSGKIVSAITSQKERERFSKMADIKARSNYGG